MSERIHVGIGGWDYEPWRETFYPAKLPKAKQLQYVGEHLTATEINATNYRLQKPETFRKWAASVPAGFKFAVKGSSFCTNRRDLADGREGVARFCAQGVTELGDRLGPILWQFTPTKRFDADEFRGFLDALPDEQDGVRLRHALEVRNASFDDPALLALAKAKGAAVVYADHESYPRIDQPTADFAYARLMGARAEEPAGYAPADLDRWAALAKRWANDGREVFIFFISGAKERNPAAAEALIERL